MVIAARSEDNEVIMGRGFESRFIGVILELAPGGDLSLRPRNYYRTGLGVRVVPPQRFRFDFFLVFFFFGYF